MTFKVFGLGIALTLLTSLPAHALHVTDSLGNDVVLEKPAQRIVALAPHIVENLFSAGAGHQIVGAVEYCDFPEAAKSIPRLGSMGDFGLESIVGLQPDLVVIWHSGKGGEMYAKLKELGLTVYASGPESLQGIAKSIRDYGILSGTQDIANTQADAFEARYTRLQQRYQDKTPIRSFYQVWNDPILSINQESLISDVLTLCGGVNVFGDSPSVVPKLSVESVISENPEAIIASGMADERPDWLDAWKAWPSLNAVKHGNLFFVPPDIIQRHSVRVLEGAQIMCEQFESARTKARRR